MRIAGSLPTEDLLELMSYWKGLSQSLRTTKLRMVANPGRNSQSPTKRNSLMMQEKTFEA